MLLMLNYSISEIEHANWMVNAAIYWLKGTFFSLKLQHGRQKHDLIPR